MEVFDLIIKWLVPFLCGGLVSLCAALWKMLKKQNHLEKAERDGIQCLLRAEIISQYEKWTERGFCPVYAREALKREYDAYHALGGNDVATDLYEKVNALPLKPQSEE